MSEFALSQLLRQYPNLPNSQSVKKVIGHEYLISESRNGIYNNIIDLYTDSQFDAPLNEQLMLMSSVGAEIYLYWNDFNANDIFGNNLLNRSSSAHGTDLVYLFGPTMYKNFFNSDYQSFRYVTHLTNISILKKYNFS